MLTHTTPRPSGNQVINRTRSASEKAIRKADMISNVEGLREMFIGYLLHCNSIELPVSDHVYASYINLVFHLTDPKPVTVPEPPKNDKDYFTVSDYANKIGIRGFNGNFASRLSRKAIKVCNGSSDFSPLGIRRYPASVLEAIFKTL